MVALETTGIIACAFLVILAFPMELAHFVVLTCKTTALGFPRVTAVLASVCVCLKFDINRS